MRHQYRQIYDEDAQDKLLRFLSKLNIKIGNAQWQLSMAMLSKSIQNNYGQPDKLIMNQDTYDAFNAQFGNKRINK